MLGTQNSNFIFNYLKKSIFLTGFLFIFSAQADRYIVAYKKQNLPIYQDRVMTQNQLMATDKWLNQRTSDLQVTVDSTLPNLGSIVLKNPTAEQIQILKNDSNVEFIEKEIKRPLPFPINKFKKNLAGNVPFKFFEQETPWGIKKVGAMDVWNLTRGGAGSRVLILDTGIDRDHPSVRPNLETAQDFVKDDQSGYPYKDTVGHGTHVAGTIAGILDSTGFSGVAPKASILAGRVCAEDGCSNIAIAEGIEWGVKMKVDVISMSLGGAWSTAAEVRAIEKAYKAGITIVAAAGNEGQSYISYPAALPECIAVGALDINNKKAVFSQWGPELAISAPGVDVTSSVPLGTGRNAIINGGVEGNTLMKINSIEFEGSKAVFKPLKGKVVYAGLGTKDDFQNLDVKGKIVLIKRGEIKFSEKVQNATAANALSVIIYNNEPGLIHGTITEDGSEAQLGAYLIEQSVGDVWAEQLNHGQSIMVEAYSVATNYSSMSGTSMATPHVSGVVALMKAANPNLSPDQVKAILQATALKVSDDEDNQTGAGLIQADKAVSEALKLLPNTISQMVH